MILRIQVGGIPGLSWDVGSGGSQEGKMVEMRQRWKRVWQLTVVRRGRGHGG